MNANNLPMVDPMMIRRFTPRVSASWFGGVLVLDEYDVDEVGMADARLDYDEPIVDCSNRIFQLTTALMMTEKEWALTAFPSRRFRNYRVGNDIVTNPDAEHPLLYLGNPVRVFSNPERGILVVRLPEFLIKSGMELGY